MKLSRERFSWRTISTFNHAPLTRPTSVQKSKQIVPPNQKNQKIATKKRTDNLKRRRKSHQSTMFPSRRWVVASLCETTNDTTDFYLISLLLPLQFNFTGRNYWDTRTQKTWIIIIITAAILWRRFERFRRTPLYEVCIHREQLDTTTVEYPRVQKRRFSTDVWNEPSVRLRNSIVCFLWNNTRSFHDDAMITALNGVLLKGWIDEACTLYKYTSYYFELDFTFHLRNCDIVVR